MKCPQCGRDFDIVEGQRHCAFCGTRLENRQSEDGEAPPSGRASDAEEETLFAEFDRPTRQAYCPWEDQENLGFVQGAYHTLKGSLFSPGNFFSAIPITGGVLSPLLYALIIGTLGAMASSFWAFATDNPIFSEAARSGNLTILAGILIPLVVFMGIVLWALVLHGSLLLVGGATENFEATFRVVCYTSAPDLFTVIPVIGGIIGVVYKLAITMIGIRAVHGISTAKAVTALLIPMAAVTGVILAGMTMALGIFGTGME